MLISPRPYPRLFHDSNAALSFIEGGGRDGSKEALGDYIIIYEDRMSKKRHISQESRKTTDRSTLCCVKRVYGAAFSGYPKLHSEEELSIIDAFIVEARRCKLRPSKTVAAQRRQLHRSAEILRDLLKEMFGGEVRKYLNRIASVLMDANTKLSWNMWTNNCQKLVDRLLNGKDFEYVFPRLPKGFGSRPALETEGNFSWPRYLISFGDRVEGEHISI